MARRIASAKPTFAVVTKTGWHGADFVLPAGLSRNGQSNVERYFDPRYDQYHRRLHEAGTPQAWLELAKLCQCQTPLIAAVCLAFTGPVCGLCGY
jgi:hypothetical protein